ncbi:GvpL/GvpF family gas vesicle protein [Geodermatophilus sp. SYSU D00815]
MLLVHGLLREHDREVLERVETGSVRPRLVAAGGLAAAVSEAPESGLTADDAVAHLDLLVALAADVPVLPLPLGTTAPDDDAVREEVLTPAADQLEHQLAAVADLVELRLDLDFDTDAVVADIARGDPEIGRLAARSRVPGAGLADRMALGEAVAARVADAQEALTAEWTAELAGIAERSALLAADEQVRRTAWCVRRERLADADAAVARLREAAAGLAEVEYVGPLPVYSFLDDLPSGPEPEPRSRWGW